MITVYKCRFLNGFAIKPLTKLNHTKYSKQENYELAEKAKFLGAHLENISSHATTTHSVSQFPAPFLFSSLTKRAYDILLLKVCPYKTNTHLSVLV